MALNDDIWQALANGSSGAPDNPHQVKMLLVRIRNLSMHPDLTIRLEALDVAARLGTADAIYAATDYAQDADLTVRRKLAAIASEHGRSGLPVFRQLAQDPDPLLAVEAVRRLTNLRDRASTSRMRGLLKARHAVVRNRAAVFLGLFGGPSIVPLLQRYTADEDQGVRAAVAWAIRRIEQDSEEPPPPLGEAGTEAPPPSKPTGELSSVPPPPDDAPPDPTAAAAPHVPPAPAAPLPRPDPQEDAAPSPPDDEADSQALSRPDIPKIFEQLAQSDDVEARQALLAQLQAAPESDLSAAFRGCRPGEEPLRNQGAALAASALENPRWITPIRKLCKDENPQVRAAVAQALGALCTPGVYTQLERLAVDSDPEVHRLGMLALAEGAKRIGYVEQAKKLIDRLPETRDPALLKIRSAALKALEAP
ncbi:MAG: HEAT repeat domain-containing protein [Deltaproteobacteria bacterium]|nr:MAG: HEAT repeat domain-containing protein [Deltaproteobacteria bacterium]